MSLSQKKARACRIDNLSTYRRFSLAERLEYWSIPEPNSGCTLWFGPTSYGYGRLAWNGRLHGAHRLAWQEAYGEIPAGLVVCHKCDVRGCINPQHLRVGTQQENIVDMYAKGRGYARAGRNQGEAHPRAKLTTQKVLELRADPRTHEEIATATGIPRATVYAVRTRQTWKHI